MKKVLRVRAATANIKGFTPMSQDKVFLCLERLFALRLDSLGTQEMWERRYRRALRMTFEGFRHFTPWFNRRRGMSECLSVRYGWRPIGRKRVKELHPGVKGEVDARQFLLWTFIKDGVKVTFINLHFLPDRVQGDNGPYYSLGIARLKAAIRSERRRGNNVIVSGDFNEEGLVLGAEIDGARLAYATHVPDHVIAIPAPGFTVSKEAQVVQPNPSDHDALIGVFTFREV